MIEMLGVLAIIGILSAGGIVGYSTAMESYRVNQTVERIKRIATVFAQTFVNNSSTRDVSLSRANAQKVLKTLNFSEQDTINSLTEHSMSIALFSEVQERCIATTWHLDGKNFDFALKKPCHRLDIEIGMATISQCIKILSADWNLDGAVFASGYINRTGLFFTGKDKAEIIKSCQNYAATNSMYVMFFFGQKTPN